MAAGCQDQSPPAPRGSAGARGCLVRGERARAASRGRLQSDGLKYPRVGLAGCKARSTEQRAALLEWCVKA